MGNLNFNSEGVEDPQSFDVLPDNTVVLVTVDETEIKPNKAGDGGYLEIVFEVEEGEHKGRKFWERLNLFSDRSDDKAKKMIKIAESQLAQLCRAVGKVQVDDHEELRGCVVQLTLGVEPARGDWPARNKVKKYGRADGSATTPAAPAEKPKASNGKAPWAR